VTGDFNSDLLHPDTKAVKLLEFFKRNNFSQLVTKPTRKEALLDHVYCNPTFVLNVSVMEYNISDHKGLLFSMSIIRPKDKRIMIKYCDYNTVDYVKMILDFDNVDLSISNDVEASWTE